MADPDRAKTVYIAVIAAALTSAATTYGLRALEGPPAPDPGEIAEEGIAPAVEVPTVVGLRLEVARELAQSRGLRLVVRAEEPSTDAEEGEIASQEPLAESQVPMDTAVEVVVSTGVPSVAVPEIAGQPVAQARAALEEAGFEIGEVSETGEGEMGTVTSTTPAAGDSVPVGTRIALVTVPNGVEVPDLNGQRSTQAREALEALGLTVGTVRRRYNANRPEFSVLGQEPEAGSRVAAGSAVNITIND